eukprot:CAMPEP_0196657486 /NCGR_PEP_ID=MMETSP1086-20130531/23680_1 /TAXON_ID=77921 /ORGANISM="Cyanoptyche  gloeocystis , Strain SAG4.97" /LENGTH=161 /DNA_ID=CAMNT_0041990631 /DNA_START=83 /DNA_END=565 /DNA_ORIENTATION=-
MPEPLDTIRSVLQSSVDAECYKKGLATGAQGAMFGVSLGLFMGTFEGSHGEMKGNTVAEQLRNGFRQMVLVSWNKGRALALNFGAAGTVFSTTECAIESYRAKHDLLNAVTAGCAAGAVFSIPANLRKGPAALGKGLALGCACGGAFSVAVDYGLRILDSW